MVQRVLGADEVLRGPPNVPEEYTLTNSAVCFVPVPFIRLEHIVHHFSEADDEVLALVRRYPLVRGSAIGADAKLIDDVGAVRDQPRK